MSTNWLPTVEPDVAEQIDDRVVRVPLVTTTLPPATRTNTYLVSSGTKWLVVDLGADDPTELRRFVDAVAEFAGGMSNIEGLLLTHHHIDHTAGLTWWAAHVERPVYAHAATWKKLGSQRRRLDAHDLADGDELLGMRVVHTPGHASGHLALDVDGGTLISGDVVAGFGTILIDPPDGNMGAYMETLRKLAEAGYSRVLPSHGGVLDGPIFKQYGLHRAMREERVYGAVAGTEDRSTRTIAEEAYSDTPGTDEELAERSTLAHLLKLEQEGTVDQVARGRWQRRRGVRRK